jgi:hypothetical protein
MRPLDPDVLRAVAKFLNDYCGEDALHRWREKLSDAERERLARAPNPVGETCKQFVETLRQTLRALIGALVKTVRAFMESAASAWATFCGRNTQLFGGETP